MEKAVAKSGVKKVPQEKSSWISPVEFFRQVKQETLKVTWPSRKETYGFTMMVFVMALIAGGFFLAVDFAASNAIRLLLDI